MQDNATMIGTRTEFGTRQTLAICLGHETLMIPISTIREKETKEDRISSWSLRTCKQVTARL